MHKKIINFIVIFLLSCTACFAAKSDCEAKFGDKIYRCSLGRTGVTLNKKEGDGATPVGIFPLRKVFYRPDKLTAEAVKTKLPLQALTKDKGWCDDPSSPNYNQEVTLPFAKSHEVLWRKDNVYDLIIVVGYNDKPVAKGKGSAIFIHIARDNYSGTAGCIAFEKKDLLEILKQMGPKTTVAIAPTGKVEFRN